MKKILEQMMSTQNISDSKDVKTEKKETVPTTPKKAGRPPKKTT